MFAIMVLCFQAFYRSDVPAFGVSLLVLELFSGNSYRAVGVSLCQSKGSPGRRAELTDTPALGL